MDRGHNLEFDWDEMEKSIKKMGGNYIHLFNESGQYKTP